MVYLLFVSGFARLYTRRAANLVLALRDISLRLSARPIWKNWIAMLSIALIAFMTLEQISPAHAATDICNLAGISVSDDTQASTSNDAAPDDAGSLLDEQQQQQRHCCSAHTSSTPPLAHSDVTLRLAEIRAPALKNDGALDHAPVGLERPPKRIAIA